MAERNKNNELQLPYGLASTNPLANIDYYYGTFNNLSDAQVKVPPSLREVGRQFAIYKDSNQVDVDVYTWGKDSNANWVANLISGGESSVKAVFFDYTMTDIGADESEPESTIRQRLIDYINSQGIFVHFGVLPVFHLTRGDSSSTNITLEQARQNGNVLEGDVVMDSRTSIKPIINDQFTIGSDTHGVVITANSSVAIYDTSTNPRGLVGNGDFTNNITAFDYTQKKYVDDRFSNNSTDLIPVAYGSTTNITKSTQVYTSGDGIGVTNIILENSIPLNSLIFISDLGNEAEMNNIIIDAGVGNNILEGNGGIPMQTMTILSSGLSYTLKKLTTNSYMVIGTNQ